ncbi:hypothetical protein BDV97DRAFT_346153 [Delphinella strobiligena]|nr:hypothetical protein BDV97DRAFT_346153 [Delphinella strobiligena]
MSTLSTSKLCTKDTVKSEDFNIWIDRSADGAACGSRASGEITRSCTCNMSEIKSIIPVQGSGLILTVPGREGMVSQKPGRRDLALQTCVSVRDVKFDPKKQGKNVPEGSWARDLLPHHRLPSRITTYSYRSDWRSGEFKTTLHERGDQLLNVLQHHRRDEPVSSLFKDM